jgi:hypothetical protein
MIKTVSIFLCGGGDIKRIRNNYILRMKGMDFVDEE